MISEYFRPASVDEALSLLIDKSKVRLPLGGGTSLSRRQSGVDGVVDLQDAGLDWIEKGARGLTIGAMTRLETLMAHPDVTSEVKRAIQLDASENIRNMATLGGWLFSSGGRSILTTVLLALDAALTWEPGSKQVRLGDWLPLREQDPPGMLITEIAWLSGPQLAFEYVARAPKDQPIVAVAVARWGSGRTRVALGGFGDAPIVALDGADSSGADAASRDAYFEAEDRWATAAYRRDIAARLALRCIERLNANKESES